MPAYITHAIMGSETYKLYSKTEGFKVNVSKSAFKTFSLGVDLANGFRGCANIAHNKDTALQFFVMVDYIKKNKLYNDSKVMSLLYGHIVHYFLDVYTHPYIYYMERGLKKVGIIKPHAFFEGAIDSYLTKKILGNELFSLNGQEYCLKENIDDVKLQKMIDYLYFKLYNIKNMNYSYRFIIRLFRKLEGIVKSNIFSKQKVKKLLLVDKYFDINSLDENTILNANKNLWLHPVTGEEHNESFEELFNKAIISSVEAISVVDSVIYNGASIAALNHVFNNASYDTGLDCKKGKVFRYKRNSK